MTINTRRDVRRGRIAGIGISFCLVATMLVSPAVSAAPSDVVISEIMYNPADAAPVEFVELANRGRSSVDLSGWCVADGIDYCFPQGASIGGGRFVVLTNDEDNFAGVYGRGVVPAGEYTGKLGNGGERIALLAAGGGLIDAVTYDDEGAWPSAPDGTGPSLELIDLAVDNGAAVNWRTSIAQSGHSVGAKNSVDGVVFPEIGTVTPRPFRPTTNDDVTVAAPFDGVSTATLVYVVNWGAERRLAMNDGRASVGGAGDGVWSATVPDQRSGDLIRYRIEAVGGGVTTTSPAQGDTINYHGVVVTDSSVISSLPVLEWFMDDAVHADLLSNHRFDDVAGEAVMSYKGVVYDNVEMHIRGNSSRSRAKVNWKVEFPKGHLFDMGGLLDAPVDEFNMQRGNFPMAEIGWDTAAQAGLTSLQYFKMRTQRNGDFYSVATYGGVYDGRWRDNNGRDTWALYKAAKERGRSHRSEQALINSEDWDKKEGDDDDWSDLHELTTMLDAPRSQAQRDWILDNINVPQVINYMAVLSVLRHSDSSWYNYYVTNDTEGTKRWEMMLWDMDQLFLQHSTDGDGDFLTPAANGQIFMGAMMNHPEFRQMYFRRARTLIDEFLQPTDYEDWMNRIITPYERDFELDRRKWGGRTSTRFREVLFSGIRSRRRDVAENLGADGSNAFPPSATGASPVEFSTIDHDAGRGERFEYLELRNTSGTESIDLSGWTISGSVQATLQPGTVLNPGARVRLVADDRVQRGANGPSFVAGRYEGALPDAGGSLSLHRRDGRVVNTKTFPNDGGGGGGGGGDVTWVELNSQWRYFDNGAAPANWAAAGFNDGAWSVGRAELGFGDGDEATVLRREKTLYFRRSFTVADADVATDLLVSLRADDGAVVYLNGQEVLRDNMPTGRIFFGTSASSTRYAGENDIRTFTIPAAALVDGTNVVAVEVHNRSRSSSDISFALALSTR